jgi:hypothetical protein
MINLKAKKMKNILYLVALLFTAMTQNVSAQNIGDLNGIYYQAVAVDETGQEIVGMDIEGKPLYHKAIGVRFTITKGLNGPIQWQETHTTTTDKYGLFSLVIGHGEQTGNGGYERLLDLPWIDADQFLKVEIATRNDGNYKMVSYQQFMSVPYSFYTDDIADNAITTEKILDYTILNQDMSTGSIDTRTLLDYTILNEDIATGSVDTRTLLDFTILNEDIATGSVDTRTLLDFTILNEDIATGSVDSRTILDSTLVNQDIATAAVDTRTLLDFTILNEDIATGSIDTRTILDNTLLNQDMATGAVDTRVLLDLTILNEDIATGSVDTRTLLNNTIINEDLSTGSVDSRAILDNSLVNIDLATGAVDSRTILNETILNEDISNSTIDLTTKVTGILPVENGGTGLDASLAGDGQLLIGNATTGDFDIGNISAGYGIVVNNSPGGIQIASTITGGVNSNANTTVNPGNITAGSRWLSPTFVLQQPEDFPAVEMGDILIASADVSLQGCLMNVYLESVNNGTAHARVAIFNPGNTPVNLGNGVNIKILVVK